MIKILGRLILWAYYAMAVFVYLGWWMHRSHGGGLLGYSKTYWIFLCLAAFIFLIPFLWRWLAKRCGSKTLLYACLPLVGIAIVVYGALSVHYYYRQCHPFDPFLQNHIEKIPNITEPKFEKEFRILLLGGSTTQCYELSEEKRFASLLQDKLVKEYSGAINFKVFNAGKAWFTSKHSLISYATYYYRWKPDLIVVMHGINDLYRSFSPPMYAIGDYNEFWSHFYGPSIDGARPPTFEEHLLRTIYQKSIFGFSLKLPFKAWYSIWRYREIDYPLERYRSIREFEIYLRRLVRTARADGAKVAVMSEPYLYHEMLSRSEIESLHFSWQVFSTRRGLCGLEYPTVRSLAEAMQAVNTVTGRIAQEEHISFIDAAAMLEKNRTHFRDDVHYTDAGSEKMAQLIFTALTSSGLLPAREKS